MLYTNKDLRKLIIPLVFEQLLAILVGMVDTVMIAGVGEAAVSGVSLVDTINILVINITAALATGGAVVAGHYLGQKDSGNASRSAWQLVLFSIWLSLAVTVIFLALHKPILRGVFGQVEPEVMKNASVYLVITAISICPLAMYNACAALFRAMSDSRTTMLIAIAMNLLNLVGNAILIYGVKMGVAGAAIATTFSRTVAAAIIMWMMFHSGKAINFRGQADWKIDFGLIKKILYIGVPNGLENSLFQLGKILLLSLVSTLGTYAIAANAVCNTLASFNVLPGSAVNLALLSVASMCIGAGDFKETDADRYRVHGGDLRDIVCLCPVGDEDLPVDAPDGKSCGAGAPVAYGSCGDLLGSVLFFAEYSAGSRGCGMDHAYCHCVHVGFPDWFCLSFQRTF